MRKWWFQGKQKINMASVLTILMLIVTGVGSTYAYNHHSTQQENLLKASKVAAEIIENGNSVDESKGFEIKHGENIEKRVRFKNTGEAAVFIRVSFGEAWIGSQGEWLASDNEYAILHWTSAWADEWYKCDDGWYYYKKILKPNEITAEVLSSVIFESYENIPEEYLEANYQLFFTMEVVQYSDDMMVNSGALREGFDRSATVADSIVTWK